MYAQSLRPIPCLKGEEHAAPKIVRYYLISILFENFNSPGYVPKEYLVSKKCSENVNKLRCYLYEEEKGRKNFAKSREPEVFIPEWWGHPAANGKYLRV